jgi:hypothetical protein
VAVIDPADEQYEAQKELAEHGALSAIATLLEDSSAAVSAAAADALLKLTQHSPAVLNRCGSRSTGSAGSMIRGDAKAPRVISPQ